MQGLDEGWLGRQCTSMVRHVCRDGEGQPYPEELGYLLARIHEYSIFMDTS